jgi:hypothetical protein
MRRTVFTTASLLSTLAVLTACSGGETSGTASPTPSAASGTSSSPGTSAPLSTGQALPFAGAPKVTNPLPASVLDGNPCTDALTPDQIGQALGSPQQGKPDTFATGPYCSWYNADTSAQIAVNYVTKTHLGLSGVYANTKPKTKTWKELPPVDGFPAVAHDFTEINCQISVGIADDLSVDVSGALSSAKQEAKADPCESTAKAANVVVENLKKKAGA